MNLTNLLHYAYNPYNYLFWQTLAVLVLVKNIHTFTLTLTSEQPFEFCCDFILVSWLAIAHIITPISSYLLRVVARGDYNPHTIYRKASANLEWHILGVFTLRILNRALLHSGLRLRALTGGVQLVEIAWCGSLGYMWARYAISCFQTHAPVWAKLCRGKRAQVREVLARSDAQEAALIAMVRNARLTAEARRTRAPDTVRNESNTPLVPEQARAVTRKEPESHSSRDQ